MRKVLVVYPLLALLLAGAGGCDATRRDFSVCDPTYKDCLKGFVCNFTTNRCVPETDAGTVDTFVLLDTAPPVDVSPVDVSLADSKDAPIGIDVTAIDTVAVDTGAIDAPPPVDVSVPDTRVPDAAGTCSVDNDCVGAASGAYCVKAKCVACKTNSQCNNDKGVPFCSVQNTCVSCAAVSGADGGSACPAATPVCATSGSCVECVGNGDCSLPGKAFCVQNQCQGCNAAGASANGPVSSGTDGGAIDGGTRDAGASTGPCSGATPVCATTGTIVGQCVGCVTSNDCSGTTPICNTTTNLCSACTSDTQCSDKGVGPGVCMFHDNGRCASDAETIYVKNSANCSGGSGTSSSPYCDSQAGVNAVTSSKRVIVLRGPGTDALSAISSTPPGAQVAIVGQNVATMGAGAVVGVHVTAGDIYLRGLTVANGGKVGLQVDAGATLRMDRCIVKGNLGGGLIVQSGANFDISNSVFDSNQEGQVGTTTLFGGIYLGGSAPSAGPHRFWFNTVVNNLSIGVVCNDGAQALTGMLLYNNIGGDYLSCAMDTTSKWSSGRPVPTTGSSDTNPPALNSTYHLTAASACVNFVTPTVAHPQYDMDGDLRPNLTHTTSPNSKPISNIDCGADEY